MASSGDAQLFDENFVITNVDSGKYARVSRLSATSNDNATTMTLDVNSELFPCRQGEHISVTLATSLSLDGGAVAKNDGPAEQDKGWKDIKDQSTLADMYDYVCYGKIYKFEDGADGQSIKAYTSFGGLLMMIEGPYKKLTPLRVDHVYLLVKK